MINDRRKDNLAIIRKIVEIMDNYPDMRFQQILYVYDIVEEGEDKFYEEPSETLRKLKSQYTNQKEIIMEFIRFKKDSEKQRLTEKNRLKEILAKKEEASLESLSIEELRKKIAELE